METISHFIFECPRYSHLRLGWRWSQVGDPKLRYKWAASKLLEMKSFMEKSKRFDDDAPGAAGRKNES